jgi:hypothetical protein
MLLVNCCILSPEFLPVRSLIHLFKPNPNAFPHFLLPSLPAWWKGIHSSDGFKNSNDLSFPRKFRDKFLLVFRHEWRWMKSKKFFVLFVKLAIFVRTAKGLPEYLDEFLRCAWGQIN